MRENGVPLSVLVIRIFLPTDCSSGSGKTRIRRGEYFSPLQTRRRLLLQFLESNEKISVSKFTRLAGITRQKAENILLKFLLLKIIGFEFTGENVFYKIRKTGRTG